MKAASERLKCAGIVGFWFGFGYFLAGLYWIAEAFLVEPLRHGWLLPFVMTALPGGMALFFAAAAALAMVLWQPGAGRVFALAIAFGLAEFARGHVLTGLPWNLIGYGVLGAAAADAARFAVRGLRAEPACRDPVRRPCGHLRAVRLRTRRRQRRGGACAPVRATARGSAMCGASAASPEARLDNTGIRLRIVQANVDQAEKWRPENSAEIFNDYLDLTKSGGLDRVNIVIWPETAVPFLLDDAPDALLAIGAALPDGTSLLVGSARLVEERDAQGALEAERVYNSLLVVDDQGRIAGVYDKIHLVPFGEFLPFQDFLESLGVMQLTGVRGGFAAGAGPGILSISGAPPASPLICYEIIFPDEIAAERRAARLAAQRHQRCVVRIERRPLSAFSSGAGARASSRACRSPARPIPASPR